MRKQQKRFTLSSSKGFTLIELLVVIAIIGILATIVMVSLNTARGKAGDAAVKADLKTIMTQSELVYDTASGSYAAVCTDPTIVKALEAATSAGGAASKCLDEAGTWVATGKLKSTTGYWCVDSVGNNHGVSATIADGSTVCPAT